MKLLFFLSTTFVFLSAVFPVYAQSPSPAGQIFIRVNQLGYRLTDPKSAVAFSQNPLPEKFQIIEANSQKVVFEGTAKNLSGRWGAFENHAELDFSGLKTQGRFFIRFRSTDSQSFSVGENVYHALPDQLLEFMRQQRCGFNPFHGEVCHPFDGRTAFAPAADGTYLNATGGWHDAGDQLKYLLTSSNATAQMLLAYLILKEAGRSAVFEDKFNALGQNGKNGLPDILDEARWGLEWMLRLHPRPDELYHQVADDRDHKGFRLPHKEIVDYGWGPGSYRVVYFADGKPQGLRQYKSQSNGVANLAGRYAAAMALGFQIWKTSDPVYAQKLLRAGREVYELGKAKEGVQQGNSYGAPYRYEETTWADDMEWAAADLFRATREKRYLEDAKRYSLIAASVGWMGKEQTGHYQFYPFMNLGHYRLYDLVDKKFRQKLADFYREGIELTISAGERNPYHIGVPFIWCSNNLVVALATQSLLYEKMSRDARYRAFTDKQRDWLVGRNPWGFSMFTEIPAGGTYPKDVHLLTNAILKKQVRGGLVDGPVYQRIFKSLKGVSISEPDPLAAFQDERAVYHDDIQDYSTNEPTMDGTASAILLWALYSLEK